MPLLLELNRTQPTRPKPGKPCSLRWLSAPPGRRRGCHSYSNRAGSALLGQPNWPTVPRFAPVVRTTWPLPGVPPFSSSAGPPCQPKLTVPRSCAGIVSPGRSRVSSAPTSYLDVDSCTAACTCWRDTSDFREHYLHLVSSRYACYEQSMISRSGWNRNFSTSCHCPLRLHRKNGLVTVESNYALRARTWFAVRHLLC